MNDNKNAAIYSWGKKAENQLRCFFKTAAYGPPEKKKGWKEMLYLFWESGFMNDFYFFLYSFLHFSNVYLTSIYVLSEERGYFEIIKGTLKALDCSAPTVFYLLFHDLQ